MCAEGVAVMDGAVSSMMQSLRGTSPQPPYSSGSGAVDEEISAMLQSNYASIRQSSLTGVIAPSGSVGAENHHQQQQQQQQLNPAAFPYNIYRVGFPGPRPVGNAVQRNPPPRVPPPPPLRGSPPEQQRPAFNMEEKYILEAKTEILDASALRNGATYGAVYEASGPAAGALHRYHSAPASTFLTEISHEGGGPHHVMSSLYSEGGLTPITEIMDMERMGGSSGNYAAAGDYEHFMASENEFGRRIAFPASLRKDEAMPDTFGTTSYQGSAKTANANLLRQTSLPAGALGLSQLSTALHDRMAENNGSEKSTSRNSDDNHLINGYTASMYSQEDFLWKSPTSPAKRHRGMDADLSETSSGSADGSTYRNGVANCLVRHMSLPSNATGCAPGSPSVDDNAGFATVPMRTRAKRGCATHPRSIAERVRRTKISERMKRLQDLVPNMDKQTNTSDMLDETVEYVKSLQQKVQELNETVAQLKAAAAAAQSQQQQGAPSQQQQPQSSN